MNSYVLAGCDGTYFLYQTEAGRSLGVPGQPELQGKASQQNKTLTELLPFVMGSSIEWLQMSLVGTKIDEMGTTLQEGEEIG